MEQKETQEGFFTMRWKNFAVMIGSLLIGSNTVTGLIFNQEQNTFQIEYDRKRTDRKIENERERDEYILKIHTLEEQVRERDKELKNCK